MSECQCRVWNYAVFLNLCSYHSIALHGHEFYLWSYHSIAPHSHIQESEEVLRKAKASNLISYLLFLLPPSSTGSKSLITDELPSPNAPRVVLSKAQLASAQAFRLVKWKNDTPHYRHWHAHGLCDCNRMEVQALLKDLSGLEQSENSKLMLEYLSLVI